MVDAIRTLIGLRLVQVSSTIQVDKAKQEPGLCLSMHIPIILLTARDRIEDKLPGFDSGADDYVLKPILPAELIARINALIRRSQRYAAAAAEQRGCVIGFWSAKRGVGTTTLAVNAAIALAQEGKKVILADLHPRAGATAMQMGLEPRASPTPS